MYICTKDACMYMYIYICIHCMYLYICSIYTYKYIIYVCIIKCAPGRECAAGSLNKSADLPLE